MKTLVQSIALTIAVATPAAAIDLSVPGHQARQYCERYSSGNIPRCMDLQVTAARGINQAAEDLRRGGIRPDRIVNKCIDRNTSWDGLNVANAYKCVAEEGYKENNRR